MSLAGTSVQVFMIAFTVFSSLQCEAATEYFVRPSEIDPTSCNVGICLTFTEYLNEADHFFQSNTSFLFMPGTHYMNKTLDISSISNILFLGLKESPQILANISCKKGGTCIAFRINYATNVTFKQLQFNLELSRDSSGVKRMNAFSSAFVSFLKFESVDINVTIISESKPRLGYAVNLYKCTRVNMSLMHIFYENDGINFASIANATVANCSVNSGRRSIIIENTNNSNIMNVTTNSSVGLYIENAVNVNVTNIAIVHASENAMEMHRIRNTTVTNVHVAGVTEGSGFVIENTVNTDISNIFLDYLGEHGILITEASSTRICNINVTNGKGNGVAVFNANNSVLAHIAVFSSEKTAVNLSHVFNTSLKDVTIDSSANHGLLVEFSNNVTIVDTKVTNCSEEAIRIFRSSQCILSFLSLLYASQDAITLKKTTKVFIENTVVERSDFYNQSAYRNGVHLIAATMTTIKNVTINKPSRGIVVEFSNDVLIYNSTTTNWILLSINLQRSRNITLMHLRLTSSGGYNQRHLFFSTTSDVLVRDCKFFNFYSPVTTTDITRQPAVIEMYKSFHVVFENTSFIRNNMSCLKLIDSDFEVNGTLQFIENRAYVGAAMLFLRNSSLAVSNNSLVLFSNNEATATGGAMHLVANDYYLSTAVGLIARSRCMLRVNSNTLTGRMIFINNTAGQGGDVLYGGSLGRACTGYNSESEYNRRIICNSCLRQLLSMSDVVPRTISSITSAPSRVCFCNNSIPDCFKLSHNTPITIYSGQTVTVSAAVVGQNFGTVAGSVFAHFIHNGVQSITLGNNEQTQGYRQQKCKFFTYTVLSNTGTREEVVLVLTAINKQEVQLPPPQALKTQMEEYQKYLNGDIFPQPLLDFPIYMNITLLPCPPGFSNTNDNPKCGCNEQLQKLPSVTCDIQSLKISRQELVWIGYVTDSNTSIVHIATSSQCPLNYCKVDNAYVSIEDTNTQCNFNHSGILCGECQAGLSLALGSNQCLECSNVYLLLLVPFALAGIALVFFIKVLDITISQGFINGFIFYANIVKANEHVFVPGAHVNPLTLFISWLNLDWGMETCFVEGMNAYTKTWLQVVFPVYVWGLAGFMILSARYSTRFARVFGNNSVPILATLFLISYVKLLRMIVTALSYTVIEFENKTRLVWSADGNIAYLKYPHILLFLAAVAILLFLWMPYTLLVLSAQWIQKHDIPLVTSTLIHIKPMLDAHYGPLKDRHWYWFGVLLVVRVIILLISTIAPGQKFGIITFSVITISFFLTAWSSTGLYRNVVISVNESLLFINLGLLAAAQFFNYKTKGNQTTAAYFLIGIVFIQFMALVTHRLYCIVKQLLKYRCSKCTTRTNTCSKIGDDDDRNWRYNDSCGTELGEVDINQSLSSNTEISQSGYVGSNCTTFSDDSAVQS